MLLATIVVHANASFSAQKSQYSKCVFRRKKVAVWHYALRAAAANRRDTRLRLLAYTKLYDLSSVVHNSLKSKYEEHS